MKSFLFKTKNYFFLLGGFFLFSFILGAFSLFLYAQSPIQKSVDRELFTIEKGWSGKKIAEELSEQNILPCKFCTFLYLSLVDHSPKSGTYRVSSKETHLQFLERLLRADYGDVYIYITFPEGATISDYASILTHKGIIQTPKEFLQYQKEEGYLYPDTYAITPHEGRDTLVKMMRKKFYDSLKKAKRWKRVSLHDKDAVTLASLVEKEAGNSLQEKQMIAGILLKRLEKGIPLQVDAPFLYERGKGSKDLSNQDLRNDSPYNTYTRKGLPKSPIGNPGYDALYAVFHPIPSPYFFYLHGKDGKVHFAKDYQEHLKNKRIYLR